MSGDKAPKSHVYVYKGTTSRGRKVSGRINDTDINNVRLTLKRYGVNIKTLRKDHLGVLRSTKIKNADITFFTRQLATMIRSGVPIVRAFTVIIEATDKVSMQHLVQSIKQDVEGGSWLHEALSKHPKYFDPLFVALVETGERSGSLQVMLDRVATYKEKSEILKMKVKKAFKYPAFVLSVSMLITVLLLVKVIPVFQRMFELSKVPLPAVTQMVVNLSVGVRSYGILFLIAIIAIGFYLRRHLQSSMKLQEKRDALLLKLPVLGNILHKSIIARFSRTLSTTFAAGLPLISALESAAKASGNAVYRNAILDIRQDVIGGQTLFNAMRSSMLFTGAVVQMTQVGEDSGTLDEMLDKVAEYYENEVDNAVDGLMSLLEPLIIVLLGVVIGVLVLAMYLPIFKMGKAF